MLYAILCYNDDADVFSWSKEKDDAVMERLQVVHDRLEGLGQLGPSLRLESVNTARTYRKTPAGVM